MTGAREALARKFMEVLNKGEIPFIQGWATHPIPAMNVITGTFYKGITYMALAMEGRQSCLWATKEQIDEQGWRLKNQAIPVMVEKVVMQSKRDKNKILEMQDFVEAGCHTSNIGHLYKKVFKDYLLYNLDDVEGVPDEVRRKVLPKMGEPYDTRKIDKLAKTMHVKVIEGDREDNMPSAYYMQTTDTVHVPSRDLFLTDYSFGAVKLHELCHATGNPKRLDRTYLYKKPSDYNFGSMSYAREELRAEIASCLLMHDLGWEADKDELTNHLGYVQAWVQVLRSRKKEMCDAIDDACMIEKYILYLLHERFK